MIDQFPWQFSPSILTPSLVMASQPFLQIGGVAHVIAAVSFALKDVNEISHIVPKSRITPEIGHCKVAKDMVSKKGLASLLTPFQIGGSDEIRTRDLRRDRPFLTFLRRFPSIYLVF